MTDPIRTALERLGGDGGGGGLSLLLHSAAELLQQQQAEIQRLEQQLETERLRVVACGSATALAGQPTPPAEGEVGELVDSLISEAGCEEVEHRCATITAPELRRAAELLQQQQYLLWLSGRELDKQKEQPLPLGEA